MVDKGVTREFEQKLAEYKQMVILRQEECVQIAKVLDEKGPQLSAKGKRYKNVLLILGVIVAANATLELTMLKAGARPIVMTTVSILFLLVGAAVSVIATLDRNN